MGYQMARIAEATTTAISPRSRLVLFRMCWHAMDNVRGDTPAHIYFGGWEPLQALFPEQTPQSQRVTVARAIRELTEAGLIKGETNPGRGKRQHYLITLPMSGG